MKLRRHLVAALTALLPIAAGCNAILGIDKHMVQPDAGGTGTAGTIGAAGTGGETGTSGAAGTVGAGGTAGSSACGPDAAVADADADAEPPCGFTMPNPKGAGLPNPADYVEDQVGNTVTENVSGLVWEATIEKNTVRAQSEAVTHCAEKGAGWRLPTRIELVSLVDFTKAQPGPTIDAKFTDTPAEAFWTSSLAACDKSQAWYVEFKKGSAHQGDRTQALRARCVRRDLPAVCTQKRYELNADGSVSDTTTGLTWQRTVARKQAWSEATTFCPSGWRLPSLTELQTIVDETTQNPPIDKAAFPNTPGDNQSFFWTSSLLASDSNYAWYVVFIHGHADVLAVTEPHWVRCVR